MSDQAIFYMADLELAVGRNRSTIITWDRSGWLPEECRPERDRNNARFWTADQVAKIKQWMEAHNPGRVQHGLGLHEPASGVSDALNIEREDQ